MKSIQKYFFSIAICGFLFSPFVYGKGPGADQFVTGFESSASISKILKFGDVRNIRQVQNTQGVTEGVSALAADFNLGSLWPTIVLEAEFMHEGGLPWNWSNYNSLSFDLTNPSEQEIQYVVRMDHDEISDHWDQRAGKIPARTSQTVRFYFKPDPYSRIGIRKDADVLFPGLLLRPWHPDDDRYIDSSRVKRIVFFTEQEKKNSPNFGKIRTLVLDKFRATNEFTLEAPTSAFIDEFGQLNIRDWPGKIHDEKDLIADGIRDLAALKGTSKGSPFYANRFKGWQNTPYKLEATGKFRVQKIDGGWWFVTPDGKLFYSSGVTGTSIWNPTLIGPSNSKPPEVNWLTDRAKIFEFVPEGNPFFNPFFFNYRLRTGEEGRTFQFLGANIAKKYPSKIPGPEACRPGWSHYMTAEYCPFAADWAKVTLHRQNELGFTSFGGWTNLDLTRAQGSEKLQVENRLAFTATTELFWYNPNKLGRKNHDPFATEFTQFVSNRLKTEASAMGCDNEWCLGYFVDNELDWGVSEIYGYEHWTYSLPIEALKLNGKSKQNAKTEFVKDLMSTYSDFQAFSKAWTPNVLQYFSSWEEFLIGDASVVLAGTTGMSEAMKRDFSKFLSKAARTYFSTVKNALNTIDPGRLYLCARFTEVPREVLEEAARYCDVMSANIYYDSLNAEDWKFGKPFNEVLKNFDKPALVGEFQFGALDRGHLIAAGGTNLRAASQADKAKRYKDYEESVLKHPNFIGAHWFMWMDLPVSGRLDDYEAFNVGFTTIGDRLHPEMAQASKEFHSGLYERRMGYLKPAVSPTPAKFRLSQNYPNPFRGSTKIDYDVAKAGQIKITVFDILGKQVAILVNEFKSSGKYTAKFNFSNFGSGAYFYRMEAPDGFVKTLKMMLVK